MAAHNGGAPAGAGGAGGGAAGVGAAAGAGGGGIDEAHWNGWLYFNKADDRLLVPKRWGWGWTVNFGHGAAPWLLLGAVVVPAVALAVSKGRYRHCK